MIGREEQSIRNYSQGMSQSGKGGRNLSHNISSSRQERLLIKPQEVMQLSPGEFIGQTVESRQPYFRAQTKLYQKNTQYSIATFVKVRNDMALDDEVQQNFRRIRSEAGNIVRCYPNIYRPTE